MAVHGATSRTDILNVLLPPQTPRAKPSAPPVPSEEATLRFFDAVIAGCDGEPLRKPYVDDGHADVDFIGGCKRPLFG